jgi:MarR family transcriptional regulator, organic hydroperoxide resistance regulator
MNSSDVELFERLYTRLWGALNRPDSPDLSQHERQLLHHLTPEQPVSLGWLAGHLGLPKSTTSTIVKRLSERGFVHRVRDPQNERQLAITLTDKGNERVAEDTVLDPDRLRAALSAVRPATRTALLAGLEQLADAAEKVRHD